MKTLLILRHAKSSWKDQTLADHDRPLNKRGRRDAPRMGALLAAQDLVPDLIFCSTARRTVDTAQAVAEACDYAGAIEALEPLYLAHPDTYVETLRMLPETAGRVLVVGHNPGLELLLVALAGVHERLPTAALARIALPIERWQDLADGSAGTLEDLWRPRELEV